MPKRSPRTPAPPGKAARRSVAEPASAGADEPASRLGEWLRRAALGLVAALVVARFYWPSEPDFLRDAGTGLSWVLMILVAATIAVASWLIGGTVRGRWSWVDAAVIVLIALVGFSVTQAVERRIAINLAWEWVAVGVAYLLARSLPRTDGESSALAGAITAAAVAVAVYGLYQVGVEYPQDRAVFLQNPEHVMRLVGVEPGTPSEQAFRDRLLGSKEPIATFALTNSLAGFLVGPIVLVLALMLETLRHRDLSSARWSALVLAGLPLLAMLTCLLLTKSRSAYLGLGMALLVLAVRAWGRLPARTLRLAGGGLGLLLAVLTVAGWATGQLDRQVITESAKSLRYRGEYWQATWNLITREPGVFWSGLGPGNFSGPYLRYKLPQSSEEIRDPHNLVLEVWATAGLPAALALLAALGLALRELFGSSRPSRLTSQDEADALRKHADPVPPPRRPAWVLVCGGSAWMLVVLMGWLNLFDPEQDHAPRWVILGAGWMAAVGLGAPLWNRVPLPVVGFGAAALAVMVNLLAAGGLSFASVALGLWMLIALGQNLRVDRPCGRLRRTGRGPAFGLALGASALVGTFVGTVGPFWKAEAALAEGQRAERLAVSSPDPDLRATMKRRAEAAYLRAAEADRLTPRPWLALADLEYRTWMVEGAAYEDPNGHKLWYKILVYQDRALNPQWRNPMSVPLHRRRAATAQRLLDDLGDRLTPIEILELRGRVVEATRRAARLYPTNATLRAELAQASAALGVFADAVQEARTALELDAITPHADKKLPPHLRQELEVRLPHWEAAIAASESERAEAEGRDGDGE